MNKLSQQRTWQIHGQEPLPGLGFCGTLVHSNQFYSRNCLPGHSSAAHRPVFVRPGAHPVPRDRVGAALC